MIIGAAVALAFSKTIQKFGLKKKPKRKINFQKENFTMQHNCSDCSAECMLRNAVKPVTNENLDFCKKVEDQKEL